MTWIDDRLAEWQKRNEDKRLIADHAEEVFNSLWEEIKRWIEIAKTRQIPVSTNGSPYEGVVELADPGPIRSAQVIGAELGSYLSPPKRLHIRLAKDKSEITISEPPETLAFGVCEDNVICLKRGGKQISIQDAARAILDPFLFPELNQTTAAGQEPSPQL